MIRCFLVINNFGKPRLIKFYERLSNEERQKAIEDAYRLVSKRLDDLCNFVEDDNLFGGDSQLIYRHFATLYFIVICDKAESELGILDLIQVYVETLDKSFENVCELDIIFNQQKAGLILDQMITGGLVLETNSQEIVTKYKELERSMKQQEKESSNKNAGGTTGSYNKSPRAF
ncbi:subunit sigma of clathrin/coatomer adaptor AP-3 complex [Chloropicon primus]|uniref:AP complex subunit sigma n=1 Tax=Chloropicon primus TaxID=1764295 RepID=A0A5B8MYK1_9CHLO|nr:subunit sigma of clathrin/coatomer adaptor AP-3 complex [Chloropicon primus]UPR03848.1 subunit sigma of clathrin/coatomer adaptor AP-3 complex [Chloropicon primus]|mmetsp:Transcript_869/g.2575  ORF Transcript_869/g.2575 Transcript_869/m.2575 type:complete len:174 (-) Transcript_869:103-624(-)|eukprot:QDZ24640.1 subunit sigma of clathrin/coatomer adaptor AP-3 complex [Chloropicon primus]